jgi:hypothetical protein
MKGFKTLAFNGAGVVGGALLAWANGVDWTQHLNPTAALVVVGAANMGLRMITSTPVGRQPGRKR